MTFKEIAIIDDDPSLIELLTAQLEDEGYSPQCYSDPDLFLGYLSNGSRPDIIILDYHFGHSHLDGLNICKGIKKLFNVPVVMLTANNDKETLIACLEAGADQYIAKPYDFQELMARMRAAHRLYKHLTPEARNHSDKLDIVTAQAQLQLDRALRTLTVNEQELNLTDKEFNLLNLLLTQTGKTLERETLYQRIYGMDYDPYSRSVDMLIARLRKKLASNNTGLHLQSTRNKGYRLVKQ